MAYAGRFKGTYYDPAKGRLALQLKTQDKQYGVDLIHTAAAEGDLDSILKAWVYSHKCIIIHLFYSFEPFLFSFT